MKDREVIQFLADMAAGLDPDYVELPDEWKGLYRKFDDLLLPGSRHISPEEIIRRACKGMPKEAATSRAIIRALPAEREYPSLARLARDLAPIDWLWKGWVPRGMLSLLGASPGAGKSLVALDLCKRIIHGEGWPDGTAVDRPGAACIYIDAEAVPQIQNERALVWGMNRDRLYLMLPDDSYAMIDLADEGQQGRLTDMCAALEPELVVVDSLSAISVRGENNVEDVRSLLGYLSNLARENACGVVLIHHLRKRGSTPMMDLVGPDDFRGSSHIIAAARSVMALSVIQDGPEPNRNGPRQFEVVKTNLIRYPPALGLVLEDGSDDRAPILRYTKDAPKSFREPNEAEQCAEWMWYLLREEPEGIQPKVVVEMASKEGWGRSTVYKAKALLKEKLEEAGSMGRGGGERLWFAAGYANEEE